MNSFRSKQRSSDDPPLNDGRLDSEPDCDSTGDRLEIVCPVDSRKLHLQNSHVCQSVRFLSQVSEGQFRNHAFLEGEEV